MDKTLYKMPALERLSETGDNVWIYAKTKSISYLVYI